MNALEPIGEVWTRPADEVLGRLSSSVKGLSTVEAEARLAKVGPNALGDERSATRLRVLWNQLKSPLLLLLVFAAAISALTGEWIDAVIVLVIVVASVLIGFSREYRAEAAVAALKSRVKTKAKVWRDGHAVQLPLEQLVPGDVVMLAAGSVVPADGYLLEATDCHLSEAVLTGESFPVEKRPGVVEATAPLSKRTNCVFLGTNVRSGTASCVIVATGQATQFGSIARKLELRPPKTEFESGLERFGLLLSIAMLVMVLLVLAAHALQGRPFVETLLFSIALAVGLSPELLPAILAVNLARAAEAMAKQGVLVRRLSAIEDLGSMDVLCTDKTGTLTEGVVRLEGAFDDQGVESEQVLELGAINAGLETGLPSGLDDAILERRKPDLSKLVKVAEVPFDFMRKRVSVVAREGDRLQLVTKGAVQHVLDVCALSKERRSELERRAEGWNREGVRLLAIAHRDLDASEATDRSVEHDLHFDGFLTFLDRPKQGVAEAIAALGKLGVSVKLITGDSKLVAEHVARLVGLRAERCLTGAQLDELHDESLWQSAERTDLFVEVDPNQKERILLALKKTGHVVGFLGDGVNDAPAMHAADTSLSVDQAVDVARAAADFVLLERGLDVIRRGVEEGRRTFANTLKYVLTTMSANLGNMASMAVASLFLPFLPLTAGQILLNNFLSDVPAVGIAGDAVDPELVAKPRRWDMRFIARFMGEFGLLSSVFDLATFGTLLWVFHATPESFRTGWFVESLLTELLAALVVRTRRPFFSSRPGRFLSISTLVLVPIAFAIPFAPLSGLLGFVPMSLGVSVAIAVIALGYVLSAEVLKRWFYRSMRD